MASAWLGDHQGRLSTLAIHRFTAIDLWHITSHQTCFKYITYEYKYKYSWSKYEYSALEYEYKYKCPWLKYEYEYKYL